jgi:pimeloyl-ACP methyl ester carboxylesterase
VRREYEGIVDCLKEIRQPALIVQGHNDVITPTVSSYTAQQHMPDPSTSIRSFSDSMPCCFDA